MRTWAILLGGMIIWTVHFFTLYIIASIWLTTPLARWLTLAVTLLCLAAVALGLVHLRRHDDGSSMDRWVHTIASAGLGVAGIAIVWQGLPALLS